MEEEVNDINNELANAKVDSAVYQDFERIWNVYFYYIVNNIKSHLPSEYEDPHLTPKDFENDVRRYLPEASKGIKVVGVNGLDKDKLEYGNTEEKYIAVGGAKLSRGFTLEGLTINYFLRQANSIDTLMQMGRWFGYRPGYLDCCKLFTIESNIEKFNEASLVIEDLEEKFDHLSKLTNRTPSDFTIWIRNNPDVIRLTRANFLKDLTINACDFSDSIKMSTVFNIEQDKVQTLWESFTSLVPEYEWNVLEDNSYIYADTNQEGMMRFIEQQSVKDVMLNLNTTGLNGYLEKCTEHRALQSWRIAIPISRKAAGKQISSEALGINLPEPIMLRQSKRYCVQRGQRP